jgi:general secretion pathway protein J
VKPQRSATPRGYTLLEVLTALFILSLLALMSYRALGAVLDTREHVRAETAKWREVAAFFDRFERDVQLAAPRSGRAGDAALAAWNGKTDAARGGWVEFSRFASSAGTDVARRVAYALNDRREIELSLWPALDIAPGVAPGRYRVLAGVVRFELQYLTSDRRWIAEWPGASRELPVPRAVQVRLVLASGEDIVRVFAL